MIPATREESAPTLASAIEEEASACARFGIDRAHFDRALFGGAREFLLRPGKAFRARLVETSFVLAGGDHSHLPRASLELVELMHAGSLVVDDIQDDADERRGAPALHRTVGMPRALNIGNWLYFVALSKISELQVDALSELSLSRAANTCFMRCHEGQALDLTLRVAELKRSEVPGVTLATTRLKTGALMSFAARLGASVAGADADAIECLAQFGESAGIALQMLDDLGSFVALDRHHKGIEDLRGQRVSWVWAWASETLDEVTYKQLAKQTARGEALDEVLLRLADSVEALGRERIRTALQVSLRGLSDVFGTSPAYEALRAELTRLEKSYG